MASELAQKVDGLAARPRIYADANVPARLVAYMRGALGWDVLFVIEDDGLRRATDLRHFQLARQLHRTLVTLDRDYLDDRRFPPDESSGVVVMSAPDERAFVDLLGRLDRAFFREDADALPLAGRKLQVHTDWMGEP
jgi:Domain of unknown function (DUF5615)